LAQVHVADHGRGGGAGHVVLDQHAVFEDGYLGTVRAFPDHHDPIDGLPPREELRLGEDRRPGAALLAAVAAALAFAPQARGPGDALPLIPADTPFADLEDGVRVPLALGVRLALAAPPPAPARHGRLVALLRLALVLAGRLGLIRLGRLVV